jgi:hypothetical protein
MDVCRSFIHNYQNCNTDAYQPVSGQAMAHTHNGILLNPKRNELSSYENTWRNLKWISLSKRSVYKSYRVCDSNSDILENAKL